MNEIRISHQLCLKENVLFLSKRALELPKSNLVNEIAPILFAMNEFQFLVSHLKNKKDLISRYYLAIAQLHLHKEE